MTDDVAQLVLEDNYEQTQASAWLLGVQLKSLMNTPFSNGARKS